MRKRIGLVLAALFLAGCGTAENSSGLAPKEKSAGNEREIVAQLKQTVKESKLREAALKELEENGLLDDPEMKEDLAVQAIEGPAVMEALDSVYGEEGHRKEGVLFYENQSDNAAQPGIWIGIQDPDERLDKVVDLLQQQVGAGKILASPIHFYRSAYSEDDLRQLQDDVLEAIQPMNTGRGSLGISADVKTGDIEISHDFLKEGQQEELRHQFADHLLHFEQTGRMVAEPGEPTTTYPEQPFTTTPSTEGSYVMEIGEGQMLVVDAKPRDFGSGDFYDAVYYGYPDAANDLKVGQRVKVEASGPIAESYPGQGSAKYVEVLPEYKPEQAKLSESEVIGKVIQQAKKKLEGMVIIRSITFNEKTANWKVEAMQSGEDQVSVIKIQDE
ncbi:hypothetical protein OXB_3336 [Bacillus sp. OxB-1]|uniref:DUF3221 domain-containing protein n=1 Tax=Bacillus sp. (strain OxB-1) TaxID=98228 RepID=UPI00058215FE|nr:DUF3221 domain-containing protein [Bacillus sp. OxB-1]BAQ11805.1 hypothetical protein OXB_3336 [Bacillus sp. OxB-1]